MTLFFSRSRKPPVSAACPRSVLLERSWRGRALGALRWRNFRLFWSGQLISLMGTGMQSIGQAWLVLELTRSPWQLGLVGALQSLPVLLFSMIGGVLADRWPKRRVLLFTQSAAMVQASLLYALIATGVIQLWHLYLLAFLLGLTNSLNLPTSRAFVAEMTGREDLPNAIALNTSIANLAHIVGPGLGGMIIAASGVRTLFLLNALSFLPVLVGLALINVTELHMQRLTGGQAERIQKPWHSLREGLSYVWRTPAISLLIVAVGLVLLFGSNFNVALPLFATDILRVGAPGFGLLSAASGFGSLTAALWLVWRGQRPAIRAVLLGMLLFSILEAAFALSRIYALSLVLIASVGFSETAFATRAMTTLQTISPDHLRGRVMSVCVLFFDGSLPLGYLLVGWLASLCGPSTGLLICAFLCLIVVGTGWTRRGPAESAVQQNVQGEWD